MPKKKSFMPVYSKDQLRAHYRARGWSEEKISAKLDDARPEKVKAVAPGAGNPYKSKAEQRVANWLTIEQHAGRIREWRYEAITLSLAEAGERCRYTPDFLVVLPDGRFRLVEVKGPYCRDDARVKFLAAQQQYPMMRLCKITVTRDCIAGTGQIYE